MSVERQKRLMRIHDDLVEGGCKTNHELAVRHGVSDSTMSRDCGTLAKIMEEEMREGIGIDLILRIKQFEGNIAKANKAFKKTGDARFLSVVKENVVEICKLRGHYPKEKKEREGGMVINQYDVAGEWDGADQELIVQHAVWLRRIKQSRNGQKVLDVEFEEEQKEENQK